MALHAIPFKATEFAEESNMGAEPPRAATAGADRPSRRRGKFVAVVAIMLVTGVLAAGIAWAVRGRQATNPVSATAPYRSAWASALKKAAVEATLPPDPADLRGYSAAGSHPFDAVFTAEEATALLNVYAFATSGAESVELRRPEVTFPGSGIVRLRSDVSAGTLAGALSIEGDAVWSETDEALKRPTGATVSFEGIRLGGSQADLAVGYAVRYANAYLQAAPGLDVDRVEITTAGAHVTGTAPDRLVAKPR